MKISKKVLIFLVLLFIFYAVPSFSLSQKVFFTLSTPRIFGPNDKNIYVNLSSKNVRYVDIKIYKLKDPLNFIINSTYKQNLRSYKFAYKLNFKEQLLNNIWERINNLQYSIRTGIRRIIPYEVRKEIKDFLGIEEFKELSPPEPPLNVRVNKFLRDEEVISFFREYIPRPKERDWWSYRRIDLPIKDIGTYLIEASYNGKVAYTLVIVNRISVTVKVATLSHKFLVFLEDKYKSLPIEGGTVYIVRKDKVLARGKTDKDGIFFLKDANFSSKNVTVIVSYGKDIAIAKAPYFYYEDTDLEIYTYTDRPIYRPGHTVYFKSIIRINDIYNYLLPPVGKKVKVTLRDPNYNIILEKEIEIDEFGSISGKIDLSDDAMLGFYTILINFEGGRSSAYFQVEDYEKPEFELNATSPKKRYKKGDSIEIKVKATYYFGEPLRDGKVRYEVIAYPMYNSYYRSDYREIFVKQGKGSFDENGEFHLLLTPKDLKDVPNSNIYINFYATDWKNKIVTTNYNIEYMATEFLLDIENNRYIYNQDEGVSLKIKAFDIDKKPFDTHATVIVRHVFWRKNQRIKKTESVEEIDIVGGVYEYLFKPKGTGSYEIEVTAKDAYNNTVKAYSYVWVTGRKISYATKDIEFITDKEEYKQGDVIHAIIALPEEDVTGLYTLEGKDIYEYKVIKTKKNIINLDIPLSSSYIGSIKLKFLFFKNGKYYSEYKSFYIENKSYKLSVEILPNKETYKPGEEGEILIKVKDKEGKGVKAELSLGIVDESIYALVYDSEDNIFDYFYTYADSYYDVSTSISYYFNFYGQAFKEAIIEAKKDSNPLADFKEGAMGIGGMGGIAPHVRKFFPDTLYFNPNIITNEDGVARVKVKFPDSLTSFRIVVKAITKDTKVGQAKKNVYVKKDIFSRMDIPPFAVEGDETYISSIVHNYTKAPKKLDVEIKPSKEILLQEDTPKKEVTVLPGREGVVPFKVKFTTFGKGEARIDTGMGDLIYDALQKNIKIYPYGYEIKNVKAGIVKEIGKVKVPIALPPDIKENTLSVKLEVDTSVIATLIPSFKYLIGYPYGCTEQTMSRLLPDIAVKRLLDLYNLKPKELKDLDKMIIKGIRRLYRYQHDDGGWGWWEFDESSPIQTAYVLFGLSLLRDSGYFISVNALNRGFWYLFDNIEDNERFEELDIIERSFSLFALTLWKKMPQSKKNLLKEKVEETFEEAISTNDVPSIAFSYILLAFSNLEERGFISQGVYELESRKKEEDKYVYWKGYFKDYHYITDVESTAWAGLALSRVAKSKDILDRVTAYLLDSRNTDRWINTKSTAITLLYLAEYLGNGEVRDDSWNFSVYIGGRKIENYVGKGPETLSIPLDAEEISNGEEIEIVKESGGVLYYRIYTRYWRENMPKGSNLKISTAYYKAIPHYVDDKYIFSKEPIEGTFKVNSIVVSEIDIEPSRDLYNVIVEVPRPAGFDYIKNDWNYEFVEDEEDKDTYWYIYKEYRTDKVVFFIDYIPEEGIKIRYMARPREKGKFHVLPPHLTLMYNPSIEGFGEKGEVIIK